jgi:REP element-mobilizing transposase RayT
MMLASRESMAEHHSLIDVAEARGWVILECPVCPNHVTTVWSGAPPRIEPFDQAPVTPGIVHAWARTDRLGDAG